MKRNLRHQIIILENDEAHLHALENLFREAGCNVRSTWSGHEALAMMQNEEFDAVLMDAYVPDMHSTDLLLRIGRLHIQPPIVIMESGMFLPAQVRRYEILGAVAVLNKHDTKRLRQEITACCRRGPAYV
jgi:CheY-like chemotaxis protein